jgi:hypothetical protein
MTDRIYPRSAREMMDGWVHLPRFVDKIRLHLAGKLHSDYSENYTKGFDAAWLKAAGIGSNQFIEVVRNSLTDGEVCDWVKRNVNKSASDKEAFNRFVLNRGADDEQAKARLEQRKREAALEHRMDVRTFVDFIDADEKRI